MSNAMLTYNADHHDGNQRGRMKAECVMMNDRDQLEAELKMILARKGDPEYRKTSADGRRCIDRCDQIRADEIRRSLAVINSKVKRVG